METQGITSQGKMVMRPTSMLADLVISVLSNMANPGVGVSLDFILLLRDAKLSGVTGPENVPVSTEK